MARQQNTPGVGVEYEISVPAYFALKLNNNEDVKDFSIRSNVAVEFGNMDDVVVEIEMTDTTKHCFAIQLKHKEKKNKKLLPTNFEAKGNFSLEKYCKAFKDIEDKNKNYHFILYTNSDYNSRSKEQLTNFRMMKEDKCRGKIFFDTSSSPDRIYRFEVNDNTPDGEVTKSDYEDFFRRFTVYVAQKNFEDLEEEIFGILMNKSAGLSYLDLFRRWHQSRFTNKTIDKKTVNIHLVDIFVSEFVITRHISDELFGRIVREFDLTIFDETVQNIDCLEDDTEISNLHQFKDLFELYTEECKLDSSDQDVNKVLEQCLLYLAKKYKIVDKSVRHLDPCTRRKILHYLFQKPLLINVSRSSEENVYHMLEHYRCKDCRIKFVLIGAGIDTKKLSNFTTFQNLHHLSKFDNLYTEVLKQCQLSIQGKAAITLEQLLQACEIGFIGAKEILRMLSSNYAIGEEREALPPVYIHRKVSTYVPKTQHLFRPFFSKFNTVIIDFDNKLELIRSKFDENQISVIEIEDYYKLEDPPQESVIISVNHEHSFEELDAIRIKNNSTGLLYLKMINPEIFIPVISKSNESSMFDKILIDEEDIHEYFTGKLNILCAQPGMGKSTMFKLLKNHSNFWSVVVDLKAHNTFLKTKHPLNEVLSYFLETSKDKFLENLKSAFFNQKKIVFFFDGLDELDDQCVDNVLDYSEEMSTQGFRVWISSRENLEARILSRFNKVSTHLVEVGENEQKEYICKRLCLQYDQDEIEQMIAKIFTSTDIVNSRQLLEIPLQLYIITQIFLDDRQQYHEMTKNIFVLTKMYKFFFDGRYKHATDKQESKNPHLVIGEPEDHFEKYEILALEFLLDEDVVGKLNLDTRRSRRFLERVKGQKDPLGIIVSVNNDKAVFEHFTYAEYFACVFFTFNFDRARILQELLFSDRYKNLLLMLNVMLAEDNPLHLAVIYRDFQQIEAHIDDDNIYDKGGRNPLHLAVTHGVKFPGCFVVKDSGWFFMMSGLLVFMEAIVDNRRLVKHVTKFDPLVPDKLFNWTCLDYAFTTRCLLSVDMVLTKHEVFDEAIKHLHVYEEEIPFATFCSLSGSVNLLKATLGENPVTTRTKWLQKSLLHDTIAYCFFQKVEMLRFWLEHGVCIDYEYQGNTVLHVAARKKLMDMVTLLMEYGASTNVTTEEGDTLLHSAIIKEPVRALDYAAEALCHFQHEEIGVYCTSKCNSIDLVRLFVEGGAEVNSRNKQGKTPLHLAVEGGDSEVVEYLVEKGSDDTICNNDGFTPLQVCLKDGRNDLAELILSKGTNVYKLQELEGVDVSNVGCSGVTDVQRNS